MLKMNFFLLFFQFFFISDLNTGKMEIILTTEVGQGRLPYKNHPNKEYVLWKSLSAHAISI